MKNSYEFELEHNELSQEGYMLELSESELEYVSGGTADGDGGGNRDNGSGS